MLHQLSRRSLHSSVSRTCTLPPSLSTFTATTICLYRFFHTSIPSSTARPPSSSSPLSHSHSPPIHPPLTPHQATPQLDNKYDLIVIGSGPAGQKCAIAAAKQRKKVAIVDRRSMLGGVCIHTGTIPSKTFREAILYLTGYRQRGFYGKGAVRRDAVKSADIMERVKKVEGWETETILDQLHRNRVVTLEGTARFLDQHHLEITPSVEHEEGVERHVNVVRADHILIATGTRPARNPMYPFDSDLVFDSDSILSSQNWDNTRHLIVVGAGVIAMEYASMFNSLPGCRVTIIDEKPSFLDFVDTEIVQTLRHIMGRRGATFRLGEKVTSVQVEDNRVRVTCDSGKICVGDALFYAVGRQGNSNALNLEAAGIQPNKRGLIQVNEFFQTSVPHIYAAGDIIGFPALASTAMEQGRLCAQHMFGHATPMRPVFPYGIYTIPEISVIGKSEQELTRDKIPYEIGIAKFEETAKGQMIGGQNMDGFLKLLFCPYTKKLLGCHCIGEFSVEIIHIGQVVISMGGTIEYFRDSVFNYPTMAETYRIAALDGLGKVHMNYSKDQSLPSSSPSSSISSSPSPSTPLVDLSYREILSEANKLRAAATTSVATGTSEASVPETKSG